MGVRSIAGSSYQFVVNICRPAGGQA